MRTKLVGVALLSGTCLVFAAPAAADIDLSGYGELSAGIGSSTILDGANRCFSSGVLNPPVSGCQSGHTDDTNTPTSLAGGLHISTTSDVGLSLQFDAEADTRYLSGLQYYGYSNIGRVTKYGTGIHLDVANDQYRAGGLFSVGNSDWTNVYANRLISVGLEGARFFDRITLFSQLTYSHPVQGYFANSGYGLDSWYLYTGARYFFRDDLMFEGDFGAGRIWSYEKPYGSITQNNGKLLHWGVKTEYRLEDFPVSLALNYQGSYGTWYRHTSGSFVYPYPFPYPFSYDVVHKWQRTEHLFMLTLRYYFGQDSLIANDRNGATINDYNSWYGAEPITEPFIGVGTFLGSDSPVL
jgi:hypothetical protein